MADKTENIALVSAKRFDPDDEEKKKPLLTIDLPRDEIEEKEDLLTPLPISPGERWHGGRKLSRFSSVSSIEHKMRKISTQTFSTVSPMDENQDRGNWSNPIEFVLSMLGYCIGLGNIWRFPVLCYENGGGAFLIPYFIMLIGCGFPLLIMEMTLGQYSSEGLLTVWKFSPLFKGLGIGMIIVNVLCGVYYNMITGWSLYYFIMSLRPKLPWVCCEEPWRTESCVSLSPESCGINISTYVPPKFGNGSSATFASEDYFHNQILKISDGVTNVGGVQWELALVLFVSWFIIFVVLCRGIKSLGKAAYFMSTFPFVILIILFIRAALEPGAINGMKYFLTPKWSLLKNAKIWSDAASQIFYSTGACQGGVITLASYNKFQNNIYRDASIMVFADTIVSFFSGLVCFSILGFMAHSVNAEIDDVIAQGPGLTFILYPQAVSILPGSPIWSAMFFFMLTTLAFSTMFPTVEIVTTSMTDEFIKLRPYKYFITMVTCLLFFLLGLPLTTNGGMYILNIIDAYGVGGPLLFFGIFEIAVVCWRYGAWRLAENIKQMLGKPPFFLLKYMWYFVSPALIVFAIVFYYINFTPLSYDDYVYPMSVNKMGFGLMCVSFIPIPIFAVIKFFCYRKTVHGQNLNVMQTLQKLTVPTENWGPTLQVLRQQSSATQRGKSFF